MDRNNLITLVIAVIALIISSSLAIYVGLRQSKWSAASAATTTSSVEPVTTTTTAVSTVANTSNTTAKVSGAVNCATLNLVTAVKRAATSSTTLYLHMITLSNTVRGDSTFILDLGLTSPPQMLRVGSYGTAGFGDVIQSLSPYTAVGNTIKVVTELNGDIGQVCTLWLWYEITN